MLTKKDQLNKNGKFRKECVKDSKYLSYLHSIDLKCIVCGSSHIELHHCHSPLREIEKTDHRVAPLCSEHHKGSECSPHGGKKSFYDIFSFEDLIVIADRLYENYLEQKNKI